MEEKVPLQDRKSLWLSVIASVLVAFLMWLLIYLSDFIPKGLQASFVAIVSATLLFGAIKMYKNLK